MHAQHAFFCFVFCFSLAALKWVRLEYIPDTKYCREVHPCKPDCKSRAKPYIQNKNV